MTFVRYSTFIHSLAQNIKIMLDNCNIFRYVYLYARQSYMQQDNHHMPLNISIQSELKQLHQQLGQLQRDAYPKAVARTLNRIAGSVRAASGKHIAPLMNTKQSDIKRRLQVEKAYPKRLWVSLVASGNALRLIAFKARATAKGVVAKAWGVNKLYKHTFIAPVKRGSSTNAVFVRKSKHSLPIKQLWGAGIRQLFKQKENVTLMKSVVHIRLPIEFKNNLQYYVNKIRA